MTIKNQNGASAVEFAIVLPLLLLLLFGIVEFGILLYDQAMITNAAREGARAGIVYDDPTRLCDGDATSGITKVVYDYAQNHLINFSSNSLNPPTIERTGLLGSGLGNCLGESGGSLTVTVTYQYDFLVFPNLAKLVGGSFANFQTLTAVAKMRFE